MSNPEETFKRHSIRCASYTSDGLRSRGHVPGECDCGAEEKQTLGWNLSRKKMPDFDGMYYVYGFMHHPCGNVTPFPDKSLKPEVERLTEENNAMLESVGSINAVMDELEELRTYKNANNWISSKDQLPDIIDGKHGGFVWAWDSNYEQGHEEFYDTVRQNPSRWTHWMHLPEPPKPETV